MKMWLDGLEITGTDASFEILRINYEMCARAFNELAKFHNNAICFIDLEVEFNQKAQEIAYALEREADNHDI